MNEEYKPPECKSCGRIFPFDPFPGIDDPKDWKIPENAYLGKWISPLDCYDCFLIRCIKNNPMGVWG